MRGLQWCCGMEEKASAFQLRPFTRNLTGRHLQERVVAWSLACHGRCPGSSSSQRNGNVL